MFFIRYPSGKIVNTKKKKLNVRMEKLYELKKNNVEFKILDKGTNADITEQVMARLTKRFETPPKGRKKRKYDKRDKKPDMNECNSCGKPTINRYKCSVCWSQVDFNIEGEYIYVV